LQSLWSDISSTRSINFYTVTLRNHCQHALKESKLNILMQKLPILSTPTRLRGLIICSVTLMCLNMTATVFAADKASVLWDALKSGGHVALIRHALAPGTGDPPEFQLGQCATQRNLSGAGRDQARHIGDRFRHNGIDRARVFSSQWCRCLETAKLLKLGPVVELAALNSFFQHYARRDSQTQATLKWLEAQDLAHPLVLVTHQVNITALTGIFPDSGELVIVRRTPTGDLEVIGTIETR
jgi:phosphohistidine phosphatase SixA